jgi:hypothetical protein
MLWANARGYCSNVRRPLFRKPDGHLQEYIMLESVSFSLRNHSASCRTCKGTLIAIRMVIEQLTSAVLQYSQRFVRADALLVKPTRGPRSVFKLRRAPLMSQNKGSVPEWMCLSS